VDVARAIPGIVAVYLFGSVAEGREHAESDVDLGVLLDWSLYPTDRHRFDCRLLLGTRFSDAARRGADVVILNDAPPQFARAIVTRGQRLYRAEARGVRPRSAVVKRRRLAPAFGGSSRTTNPDPAPAPATPAVPATVPRARARATA
jgi:predicted nucleotidyltransferase